MDVGLINLKERMNFVHKLPQVKELDALCDKILAIDHLPDIPLDLTVNSQQLNTNIS